MIQTESPENFVVIFEILSIDKEWKSNEITLTWIKACVWLICEDLDILSNLVSFIKSRLLINYLHVNISFSDNLLDLCDHVTGHALNWKKYDRLSDNTFTD